MCQLIIGTLIHRFIGYESLLHHRTACVIKRFHDVCMVWAFKI